MSKKAKTLTSKDPEATTKNTPSNLLPGETGASFDLLPLEILLLIAKDLSDEDLVRWLLALSPDKLEKKLNHKIVELISKVTSQRALILNYEEFQRFSPHVKIILWDKFTLEDYEKILANDSLLKEFTSFKAHKLATNADIVKILEKCPKLKILDLANCENLKTLTIPKEVTNLNLTWCKNLTTLIIPEGSNLTNLNLKGCNKIINSDAEAQDIIRKFPNLRILDLEWCTNLTTLTISTKVTDLNLTNCENLKTLTIPKEVTNLNLTNCRNLKTLIIPEDSNLTNLNLKWCNKIINSDAEAQDIIRKFPNLKILNLSECFHLKNFTIEGSNLTTLDLSRCERLETLTIPEGSNITNLNLTACNTFIDSDAKAEEILKNCLSITSLNLRECIKLENLTIPKGSKITNLNLGWCRNLETLTIPEGYKITTLNLSGCNQLINSNAKVEKIFKECPNITNLYLALCRNLETLTIPKGSKITNLNLAGCENLETLTIPEGSNITNLNLFGCDFDKLKINLSQKMSESEFWKDIKEKYPDITLEISPNTNISKTSTSNLSKSSSKAHRQY